jgi:hypothetical protein
MEYKHKWVWGAVVEERTREGEVASLNPHGREAHNFHAKICVACGLQAHDMCLTGGGLLRLKKKFCYFWEFF